MDKQVVLISYIEMLPRNKKKKTCWSLRNNMDESEKHYVDCKKPDSTYCMIPFILGTRIDKANLWHNKSTVVANDGGVEIE